jgi:hypothetical protein
MSKVEARIAYIVMIVLGIMNMVHLYDKLSWKEDTEVNEYDEPLPPAPMYDPTADIEPLKPVIVKQPTVYGYSNWYGGYDYPCKCPLCDRKLTQIEYDGATKRIPFLTDPQPPAAHVPTPDPISTQETAVNCLQESSGAANPNGSPYREYLQEGYQVHPQLEYRKQLEHLRQQLEEQAQQQSKEPSA